MYLITANPNPTKGLFQKNPNRGWVKDMEFPGVLKKNHVEFLEINSKRSRISRGDQEKIMRNSQGSWILALEFPMAVTQFGRISRGEALFRLEFSKGKITNLEIPGVLSCPDFFWNSPKDFLSSVCRNKY